MIKRLQKVKHKLQALYQDLVGTDPLDLVLRLTLLDFLLRPVGDWKVRPFVFLLAGASLLSPRLLRSPITWLILTLLTGWRVILDWPLSDNHAYLLCYWCLGISLSLLMRKPHASLALNGRLLIGLAFLLAVLWKGLLSADYLNGTFFRVTMMTDGRFADVTRLVGGMSEADLNQNRYILEANPHDEDGSQYPKLIEPPAFQMFAQVATWWTLLTEATVAVCFLWPTRGWFSRQRDIVLMLFCATTYAVAPVAGFGWLLIVMGLAQCEPQRKAIRSLYLLSFCLILFYKEIPWAYLLIKWS